MDLLKKCKGEDFGKDIIPELVKTGKVLGYDICTFNMIPGFEYDPKNGEILVERTQDSDYWEDAGKIGDYHAVHMDLLGVTPRFNIHSPIDSRNYELV